MILLLSREEMRHHPVSYTHLDVYKRQLNYKVPQHVPMFFQNLRGNDCHHLILKIQTGRNHVYSQVYSGSCSPDKGGNYFPVCDLSPARKDCWPWRIY